MKDVQRYRTINDSVTVKRALILSLLDVFFVLMLGFFASASLIKEEFLLIFVMLVMFFTTRFYIYLRHQKHWARKGISEMKYRGSLRKLVYMIACVGVFLYLFRELRTEMDNWLIFLFVGFLFVLFCYCVEVYLPESQKKRSSLMKEGRIFRRIEK